MKALRVQLTRHELEALQQTAARSDCSVAELARKAIQEWLSKQANQGPLALWGDEAKRSSTEHDSAFDEPA
jgi:hypothetical protein